MMETKSHRNSTIHCQYSDEGFNGYWVFVPAHYYNEIIILYYHQILNFNLKIKYKLFTFRMLESLHLAA